MFYSLTGKTVFKNELFVAINCGGVAFKCFTTRNTLASLPDKGTDVTLYTYLSVREDALDLFGFISEEELECFKLLIGVSGVGPKAALAILSELSPSAFYGAVSTGDAKSITAANGVGPKIAQRIIMELKDKIGSFALSSDGASPAAPSAAASGSGYLEAVSALVALGYSQAEASEALKNADRSLPAETLIKEALKNLVIRF